MSKINCHVCQCRQRKSKIKACLFNENFVKLKENIELVELLNKFGQST